MTAVPGTQWWADLLHETEERVAGDSWQRRFDPTPPVFLATRVLAPLGHFCQVGTWSVRDRADRTLWLSQEPVTYSELLATWVGRQGTGHRYYATKIEARAPLWFEGPLRYHPDLAYVDMQAFYPSLFGPMGWDFRYNPKICHGSRGAFPFVDFDRLAELKPVRNLLWGNFQSRRTITLESGRLTVRRVRTTALYRPMIVQAVYDLAHAVARDARANWPVIGWHTDGAVLPGHLAAQFQEWLLSEWGLRSVVKARGPSTLFTLNCRIIGDRPTLDLQHGVAHARKGRPVDNLRDVPVSRLKALRNELLGEAPVALRNPNVTPSGALPMAIVCPQCHERIWERGQGGENVSEHLKAHREARLKAEREHPKAPPWEEDRRPHHLLTGKACPTSMHCVGCDAMTTVIAGETPWHRGPWCPGCVPAMEHRRAEDKAARLAKERARAQARRAAETPEAREVRLAKERAQEKAKRQRRLERETPEAREVRLAKERARDRARRAAAREDRPPRGRKGRAPETPEAAEARRAKERLQEKAKRQRRIERETPEQVKARRAKELAKNRAKYQRRKERRENAAMQARRP